jgi:hypothetical protein
MERFGIEIALLLSETIKTEKEVKKTDRMVRTEGIKKSVMCCVNVCGVLIKMLTVSIALFFLISVALSVLSK